MITFGYLAGWDRITIEDNSPLSFINQITDTLSRGGTDTWRDGGPILADFDGIIYVTGESLSGLPTLTKELQEKELQLPLRRNLRVWNELLFNLYPNNSIVEMLRSGHVRGVGLYHSEWQRLYGGHLLISKYCIELSASFTSIDILFELRRDMILGLQSLTAIISNLEGANLIGDIKEWRLTLRPGMLYEEIYNGRDS